MRDNDCLAIIAYQHSMPWLEVTLQALCKYRNDRKLGVILVENYPNQSRASISSANGFIKAYKDLAGGEAMLVRCNISGVADPGARHARALQQGYRLVKHSCEWTLFLDSDCVPIRDHWLDYMFECNRPVVGPPAFHNLPDYSIPHAHPSLLLFQTKLATRPYWHEDFIQIRRHPDTGQKIFWDVGIGFTHRLATQHGIEIHRLGQEMDSQLGYEFYRIEDLAIHMRGTTNVTRRKYPQDQKRGLLVLPEFSFYKEGWLQRY